MSSELKQLIVVVEGTAALGPYWQTIVSDYLLKIIRFLSFSSIFDFRVSEKLLLFELGLRDLQLVDRASLIFPCE